MQTNVNRELIYTTLFDLLKDNLTEVKYFSRRIKLWSEVAQADTPALFLQQGREVAETISKLETKWTFYAELYLYVNIGNNPNTCPYTKMNPILDKIAHIFDANNNMNWDGLQTLNGLVHSVKINGEVENDGGSLGPISVAIIPLEIVVC